MDNSSICLCQIYTSPYRKLTSAWSVTGEECLCLRIGTQLVLASEKPPASAFLIKKQTDFVYMQSGAGLQAVEGPCSYWVSGGWTAPISIHVTVSGSARGLTMHRHLDIFWNKKKNMQFEGRNNWNSVNDLWKHRTFFVWKQNHYSV